MWRQVRGPAGAVMCETRDLGIKWQHGHTLVFEGEARIDMRNVCPKDVKKMLAQQARSVHWKTWAAKHEYEELKEGKWLEQALALLRKKIKRRLVRKASKCGQQIIFGRRLGAEETLRHWFVELK